MKKYITLEEVVNNFKKTHVYINEIKQEQERMYSEEDMKKCWEQAQESKFDEQNTDIGEQPKRTQPDFEDWFGQFKKIN